MNFEELSYKSKIKICELFYRDFWKIDDPTSPLYPSKIYFSWTKVIFETKSGEKSVQRLFLKDWYENNNQIIRKEKLLEIRKNLT